MAAMLSELDRAVRRQEWQGQYGVRRPHIRWDRCRDKNGRYVCTRAQGHGGRHSAGTLRAGDGSCEVVAVWR